MRSWGHRWNQRLWSGEERDCDVLQMWAVTLGSSMRLAYYFDPITPPWSYHHTVILSPHTDPITPHWSCHPTLILSPHSDPTTPHWSCHHTVILSSHTDPINTQWSYHHTLILSPHTDPINTHWSYASILCCFPEEVITLVLWTTQHKPCLLYLCRVQQELLVRVLAQADFTCDPSHPHTVNESTNSCSTCSPHPDPHEMALGLQDTHTYSHTQLHTQALGLGRFCSKIRPLCYSPMLPTTSCYALGRLLLCSIRSPWLH